MFTAGTPTASALPATFIGFLGMGLLGLVAYAGARAKRLPSVKEQEKFAADLQFFGSGEPYALPRPWENEDQVTTALWNLGYDPGFVTDNAPQDAKLVAAVAQFQEDVNACAASEGYADPVVLAVDGKAGVATLEILARTLKNMFIEPRDARTVRYTGDDRWTNWAEAQCRV
jgi:hypothetical protein